MKKELKQKIEAVEAKVEAARRECIAASDAYFPTPGKSGYDDFNNPARQRQSAAYAALKESLAEARMLAGDPEVRKAGVLTVSDSILTYASVSFESKSDVRRKEAKRNFYNSAVLGKFDR